MTILDDLFNLAEENWNSIQGTADNTQLVVVYAAMAQVWASDLKASNTFEPLVPPIDRLIYNPPIALKSPAAFVGSSLTITAPNFHISLSSRIMGFNGRATHPRQQPTTRLPSSTFMLMQGDGATSKHLSQSLCTISD